VHPAGIPVTGDVGVSGEIQPTSEALEVGRVSRAGRRRLRTFHHERPHVLGIGFVGRHTRNGTPARRTEVDLGRQAELEIRNILRIYSPVDPSQRADLVLPLDRW
jgi:hypothetical protein